MSISMRCGSRSGVKKLRNGAMRYDDDAPLAYIRKSIVDPKSNP